MSEFEVHATKSNICITNIQITEAYNNMSTPARNQQYQPLLVSNVTIACPTGQSNTAFYSHFPELKTINTRGISYKLKITQKK